MISFSKYKKFLHLDIETYSSVDIKNGVYKYADSDDFEILIVGYAYDEDPVKVIELVKGEELPEELRADLRDPAILKIAHNATFERVCFSRYLLGKNAYLDCHGWICTAVMASMLGLLTSLKDVGNLLNLREEDKKQALAGARLIKFFSVPQKPIRTNNYRTRNLPADDPDKWDLYVKYNINDVIAEREIFKIERNLLTLSSKEYEMYCLDAEINDLGVGIDKQLCVSIDEYINEAKEPQIEEMAQLTHLENPNSPEQLKNWLSERLGMEVTSLAKADVQALIKKLEDSDPQKYEDVIKVLTIRQLTSKSSNTKYAAIINSAVYDNYEERWKCHGTLQFYGANRTGRWAGRIIQTQNLPKNTLVDLATIRQYAKEGDFESIELIYPSVAQVTSELIRTALIPSAGSRFVVCDYNAIESRVAAWLADEQWKIEAFKANKKIYEETASKMFNVPVDQIAHDSPERAKGKVAELAGQYQGGLGAYKNFGADKFGLSDDEIWAMVNQWRDANPHIVKFWYKLERAVKTVIENPGTVELLPHGLKVEIHNEILFITLPSKRRLAYQKPELVDGSINYYGEGTNHRWVRLETYGGKLFENVVQAIARDCLRDAMLELAKYDFKPRFHVHDEVVIEVSKQEYPDDEVLIDKVGDIMAKAAGCYDTKIPLRAAGYCCDFYLKD